MVYRDRTIEVPVPVVRPLPARLTADCEPRVRVPADGPLTVAAVLDRLAATEDALAVCRNQLGELRGAQP